MVSKLDYFLFSSFQVSVVADDILKNVEFDALRIIFNKFHSVVQFLPSMATVLSPEVDSSVNRSWNSLIWCFLLITSVWL